MSHSSKISYSYQPRRKLLEIELENLQRQTDIEVEEAQEKVYAQYEQYEHLTGLSFLTTDTQRNTQVSVSQAHEDDAPVNAQITVRRKHVMISDDVTDWRTQRKCRQLHVPSILPIGEASWEQLSDQHGDGHVAVTSAGAGDVTPEYDTAGIGRQIPAPPNTTCSAQPRSHTPAPMAAPRVNLPLPNTRQVTAHSVPDSTQTTSVYQTRSGTASPYPQNMPNTRQRLTYDSTAQQLLYDPYAMYMPYGHVHQDGCEVTYQVCQRHVTLRDDSFTSGLHR